MKSKPILFSAPMIRALLDGRKTQTRRIIKPQPEFIEASGRWKWKIPKYAEQNNHGFVYTGSREWHEYLPDKAGCCPYGKPGDLLWVRETWTMASRATDVVKIYYKAHEKCSHTDFHEFVPVGRVSDCQPTWPRFKPSIHMPRWASRLTLELTSVRVERLNEISEVDKLAEGGTSDSPFGTIWRAINTKPGIRWEDNPWVWVLEFQAHRCNVDSLLEARAA